MKSVHLVCNAHLDPIWQWEWEEGAASALSTFKSAVDLADEFDYIFCHNEVTLYKYIEEYAPALFKRIKELIRQGKWHIMGGWYLQPDCNMPSGESIVRQILMGHRYFKEKFDCVPTSAMAVDAFGHSVGLVQIIKKCGQDSYLFCRTGDDPLPEGHFLWEGLDGSSVKAEAVQSYNSPLGGAADKIKRIINDTDEKEDTICVLWGVGNHGGGPSRKDLADIKKLMEESDAKIIHSTPEGFFASINPTEKHTKSFRVSMPGCYTSVSEIKLLHAKFEDTLYMTEKLCSVAAMQGLIDYPENELDEAVEDLLNAEFHDVLPGSSIKAGEENGIMLLNHGLLILNKLRAKAYFALTSTQKRADDGEYPILVFNPHPYEWDTEIECEFTLADQNWRTDIISSLRVVDENGDKIPFQFIKEESNLNLDWRKRFIFKANLKPLAISRFSVYAEFVENKEKENLPANSDIIVESGSKRVEIDGKTGLLRSYKLNGKEYVKENAFLPYYYEDNADPWGMGNFQLKAMGKNPSEFKLMEKPDGVFEGMQPIQVIEDGDIYTGVECFFKNGNTRIRVEYDIYKLNSAIDIKLDIFSGDINKMIRLSLPYKNDGEYIGQTMFGTEPLYQNGKECVAQRFVAIKDKSGECLALFNKGTYGSMCKDAVISMSLLRTATYCAHPIETRELIPTDRYVKKIDIGESNFFFRLDVVNENELERKANEFCQKPYACNVFPIETDVKPLNFDLKIEDKNIVLITMKKKYQDNSFILRFLNNSPERKKCNLVLNHKKITLNFGKYEVKTVLFDFEKLSESPEILI